MSSIAERGGKLLAICLTVFLVAQVFMSANKLMDKKTSISTTTEYEDERLMPSISVCFPYPKSEYQGNSREELVMKTLNDTR